MKVSKQNSKPVHSGDAESNAPAKKPVTVLHVDDDPNDTTLLQGACARAAVDFQLQNVGDGTEVGEYLSGEG